QTFGQRRCQLLVDAEQFERAREPLEAGNLDRVRLRSCGEYLAVNRRMCLCEGVAVEALAERRFQRGEEQGSRASNFAPAPLHERQRFEIPVDERVEQIDHDRLVTMLSHARSTLPRCPRLRRDSTA